MAQSNICSCTIRFCLFTFNFIFVICGIALVALGSVIYVTGDITKEVINSQIKGPSIAIIVIGLIICLIAFMGCCGALKQSYCMIITYSSLLLTVMIVEFVVGVLAFTYQSKFTNSFEEELSKKYTMYETDNETKAVINAIQEGFHCCGYNNFNDFKNTTVPPSCCIKRSAEGCFAKNYWPEGCKITIAMTINSWLKQIGGVLMAFVLIQIIGVVFSIRLGHQIRDANDYF